MRLTALFRQILRESRFNFTSFNLTDRDLIEIATWNLKEYGVAQACFDNDNPTFEEEVTCLVHDYRTLLQDPFPMGFRNIPDPVPVLRVLKLKSPEQLNREEVGGCWFTDPKSLKYLMSNLDFNLTNNPVYLIKATTPLSNVDVALSLVKRRESGGENEIYLRDNGRNVTILFVDRVTPS